MAQSSSITTTTVEVPPNKAIAAGGSATIGAVVVALALHYLAPNTPAEIVALWAGLVNTIVATAAVYLTPHGAVVKEN